MKLAVISDVHANLPALEAVLADIEARQVQALYCLGDLVGYAPWPNEVVRTVWAQRIPTIAGNYDVGVGLASDDCGCAYRTDAERALGAQSIAYTNETVTDAVRGLPRHLRLSFGEADAPFTVLMVHGSPRRVNEYLFEDRPESSLLRMMARAEADVMLFGHTHKPYVKRLAYEAEGEARYRTAINTGSVGKPKDGDSRACYLLLEVQPDARPTDPESVNAEFVRVPYDIGRAARAIEESPLPDAYAKALLAAT